MEEQDRDFSGDGFEDTFMLRQNPYGPYGPGGEQSSSISSGLFRSSPDPRPETIPQVTIEDPDHRVRFKVGAYTGNQLSVVTSPEGYVHISKMGKEINTHINFLRAIVKTYDEQFEEK